MKKFALASALSLGALGAALAHVEGQSVHDRAVERAEQAAALTAHLALLPIITPGDLDQPMTFARRLVLDAEMAGPLRDAGVVRIKVWNPRGEVVYSDDAALIGQQFPMTAELAKALSGGSASDVSSLGKDENGADRSYGHLLEAYVPIEFAPGQPLGAFELYTPWSPVEDEIVHDTERLSVVLAAGFTALYLLLFRIVAGASRRLRQQNELNQHQATHDVLTDLPNRALFADQVAEALASAKRDGRGVAVVIADLDRFKEVNEAAGYEHGDQLLKLVGPRLRALLSTIDVVARLGGNEFGVLLGDCPSPGAAERVASRLLEALQQPYPVGELTIDLEASLGLATYPDHADDAVQLVQRADAALYSAKQRRGGIAVYSGRGSTEPRLAVFGELRRAIPAGQLVVHYQPVLELPSLAVRGVEALVRWQHPERGLITPDGFIPLAEQTGLIKPLTRSVLVQALHQLRAWSHAGLDLELAVNLSPRVLHDPDLIGWVATELHANGIAPDRLELEVTESAVFTDPERARAALADLTRLGVRIALDDFGTGYSSLSALQHLSVHTVKIDKSFVREAATSADDRVIVTTTVELSHGLGLGIVAEGVETPAALDLLVELGCERAQGYLFSPPLPAADLERWLDDRTPAPSGSGRAWSQMRDQTRPERDGEAVSEPAG